MKTKVIIWMKARALHPPRYPTLKSRNSGVHLLPEQRLTDPIVWQLNSSSTHAMHYTIIPVLFRLPLAATSRYMSFTPQIAGRHLPLVTRIQTNRMPVQYDLYQDVGLYDFYGIPLIYLSTR